MKWNLSEKKNCTRITLGAAVLGFFLRFIQRRVSLGDDGYHSAKFMWPLIVLSALVLLFALLAVRGLRPRAGFRENSVPTGTALLALPAALLLAVSCVLRFFAASGAAKWLLGPVGLLGAVCLGVLYYRMLIQKEPSFLLGMGLTISLICKLIIDFRSWSADPSIGDYCFRLFAMISVLCVSFQLCGFALDRGERRTTAFFAVAGVFFSGMTLADGGVANLLAYLSYALFEYAVLDQMLTVPRRRRRREPAAEPQQPAEPAPHDGPAPL